MNEEDEEIGISDSFWIVGYRRGEGRGLIYSGNPKAAWEFYGLAYPDPVWWKAGLAEDFRRQLASSPYYSELD